MSTAICLMKSAYFLIRGLVRSGDARDYRFRTPVLLQLIFYPFALMLAARVPWVSMPDVSAFRSPCTICEGGLGQPEPCERMLRIASLRFYDVGKSD